MEQLTAEAAAREPAVRYRLFWTLGLGAFGLAFSITTTAAYLPPLLNRFTESGTLIGLVLGAEGVFAIALSPVIGPWSDTFHTPLGRRRPFMLAALFPLGFCLLLMPFMPTLWTTTMIVLAFFFAYYVYEPPYRGLYPDLLPPSTYGRAQGIQHVLRGIALGDSTRRRRLPAEGVARGAVRAGRIRDDGGVWRHDPVGVRGRRPRPCLRRRRRLLQAELVDLQGGSGGAALPAGERGVGGNVRSRAHVRRPLRDRRAARVEGDLLRDPRRRCHRLRDRRALRGAARRPVRDRARHLLRVVRLRRRIHRCRRSDGVARLVLRLHRPGGRRRRNCHDARLGVVVQAHARRASRCDFGARDDDEGPRLAAGRADRRGRDRHLAVRTSVRPTATRSCGSCAGFRSSPRFRSCTA